jgi:neutral ceramidase
MADKQLFAGAAAAVITPGLGTSLCGSMQDRLAENIHDDLHARALVLDNDETRIALVVLDLIAASKSWLSEIKHQVQSFTGIPMSNVLIACTHTHSAATPVAVFQSNVEKEYLKWAGPRVADAVRVAVKRLRPARLGWAVGAEDRVVFNRRYFLKPGTRLPSPFPGIEDKVKMNPGPENPAIVKPAGPIDPDLPLLAVQRADRPDGQPLAVFASYALHYVGNNPSTDVSADYFALVADRLQELTGGPRRDPSQPFVGLLANGCFGDINNVDVRKRLRQPYPYHQMNAVADIVAQAVFEAWKTVRYHAWVPLAVQEQSLDLAVRKPTADEVQQAREILMRAPQGPLRTLPEIYARETVQLADWPDTFKTPVQCLRIGDLAICALPGEPFCQTGLDIKAKSPFKPTMMVGMANDYAGYLPTEEQHALGGYETWRAKSSFLEVKAADKIQHTARDLLAQLAR